jgi:hypothetical protein
MRTLIVSDLHLGSVTGADVLRRGEILESLLAAARESDRVILLGDVIEMRHGPLRDAMQLARPVFEGLGQALAGRELVLLAGNHDHGLIEPWLTSRGEESEPPPLALEQLLEPAEASPAYAHIAAWCAPARVRIAYPGLWVRPDVYATHGHYLDLHLTIPTLERLSVGLMARILGRRPSDFAGADDYEAAAGPVFAWRDAVARDGRTGNALNGIATVTAWRALGGGSDARLGARTARLRALRRRMLVGAFPLAVAALNRAGVGPLRPDISNAELRRAGLRAMDEVSVNLGLGDAHVVFGHTHRTGPLPHDPAEEWHGRRGARLFNTGSWTYSDVFLTATPGESPYWPGGCVIVEDAGPPRVEMLLADRSHADISPPSRRPAPARTEIAAGSPAP